MISNNTKDMASYIFWFILFIAFNIILHIILTSIITFFHLQLDHRLVDIQDWIQVNSWSLYFFRLLISFYILEKLISVFYVKKQSLKLLKEKLFFDLNYKVALILSLSTLCALVLAFIPEKNTHFVEFKKDIIFSYLGSCYYLTLISWTYIIINECIIIDKKYHYILSFLFVVLLYFVEFYLLKLVRMDQDGSFFLIYPILILTLTKAKDSIKLALVFIAFVLSPFIAICGLDIMHGSKFSPLVISDGFNIYNSLCLSFILGFFLNIVFKKRLD